MNRTHTFLHKPPRNNWRHYSRRSPVPASVPEFSASLPLKTHPSMTSRSVIMPPTQASLEGAWRSREELCPRFVCLNAYTPLSTFSLFWNARIVTRRECNQLWNNRVLPPCGDPLRCVATFRVHTKCHQLSLVGFFCVCFFVCFFCTSRPVDLWCKVHTLVGTFKRSWYS